MVELTLILLDGIIDLVLNTDMVLLLGLAIVLTILGFIYKIILNN